MAIFQPIHHAKTAETVAHQIEGLILEGVLKVGDRLPAERDLAQEIGVSRPIVREAIKALETSGMLESRHGEGTFVANVIGTIFSPQIGALIASHRKVDVDYLEYRREVEAIAARLAAERATPSDREMLSSLMRRMDAAYEDGDFGEETRLDVEFHSVIGEMAHNLVLLHTLRACYRLLSEGVFQNRSRLYHLAGARRHLFEQHHAIADAIMTGDGEAAAEAARRHMDYVAAATRDMESREDRERIAQLRLERQEGRSSVRMAARARD